MARKSTKKQEHAPKTWLDVKHHHEKFFTNDGQVLTNLAQLPEALENMDAKTFASHMVAHHGNDFSHWVQNVVKENSLAQEMHKLKSKHGLIRAIRRRF